MYVYMFSTQIALPNDSRKALVHENDGVKNDAIRYTCSLAPQNSIS